MSHCSPSLSVATETEQKQKEEQEQKLNRKLHIPVAQRIYISVPVKTMKFSVATETKLAERNKQ